jgi:pilus assembly protein CpaE
MTNGFDRVATLETSINRILILHPVAPTRRALEQTLRSVTPESISIHHAGSLSEGVQVSRWFEPEYVFLDLDGDHELSLEVARELRGTDRQIVGIFNPLLRPADADSFFLKAARAGVGDFVPLPASESELKAALAAVSPAQKGETTQGRLVTFFSQQGGVGVTTLAVNTAAYISQGKRAGEVALCDTCLQFGTAAAYLGIAADRDFADLVKGADEVEALSTYLSVHQQTDLRVLPSPQDPIEAEQITPKEVDRVLLQLRRRFDTVIIDTPPVLDLLTLSILDLSELVFVVTEAVAPAVLGTARFLDLLEKQGFVRERQRLVVNRYADAFEGNLAPGTIAEQVGRPVDYIVPFDRDVVIAANRGEPLILNGDKREFSQAIGRLADDVTRPIQRRVGR